MGNPLQNRGCVRWEMMEPVDCPLPAWRLANSLGWLDRQKFRKKVIDLILLSQ